MTSNGTQSNPSSAPIRYVHSTPEYEGEIFLVAVQADVTEGGKRVGSAAKAGGRSLERKNISYR
jgi:hypothetical protein